MVDFRDSPELREMSNRIRSLVVQPDDYQVMPHMSLFYGKLSDSERETFRREIELPESIVFDVVTAIANPAQVASREDVEAWREVGRRWLR
jgi:hypothetical protein